MLIVEDNMFCSYALKSLLQQFQVSCDVARDGQEAIKLVKERSEAGTSVYKLIIADLNLPRHSGLDVTMAIRKLLKKHRGNDNNQTDSVVDENKAKPYICLLTTNKS